MSMEPVDVGGDVDVESRVNKQSRRDVLRALALAGGASAVGAGASSRSVAAADSDADREEYDLTDREQLRAFVATDSGIYATQTPDAREAIGMAYMFTWPGVLSANVAGHTDPDRSTFDYMHEYLFGPFEVEVDDPIESVVDDTVYYSMQDDGITLTDLFQVLGHPEELWPVLYAEIESETVRQRNAESSRGATKAAVKQHVRDEILAPWQANYLQIGSQASIRSTGLFSYHLAAQADNDDWRPTDNYLLREYGGSGPQYWENEPIQVINPTETGVVELVDGSEMDVELLNIQFDTSEEDDTDLDLDLRFLPFGGTHHGSASGSLSSTHDDINPISNTELATDTEFDSWNSTLESVALCWDHGSEGRVVMPVGRADPSDDGAEYLEGEDYRMFYSQFIDMLSVVDDEIEEYVDVHFDNVDPGEINDPENRTPGSMSRDASLDWVTTGYTGFSAFFDMSLSGGSGSFSPASVDYWANADADDSDIGDPDESWDDAWIVIDGDGLSYGDRAGPLIDDEVHLPDADPADVNVHFSPSGDAYDDADTGDLVVHTGESFDFSSDTEDVIGVEMVTADSGTYSVGVSIDDGSASGSFLVDDLSGAFGESFDVEALDIDYLESDGETQSSQLVDDFGTVAVRIDDEVADDAFVDGVIPVGERVNVDADGVGGVTIHSDSGARRLDDVDAFEVTEFLNADGDALDYIPLSSYTRSVLDNSSLDELFGMWADAAEDYNSGPSSGGGDSDDGSAGDAFGDVSLRQLGVAGAAAAAVAGAARVINGDD